MIKEFRNIDLRLIHVERIKIDEQNLKVFLGNPIARILRFIHNFITINNLNKIVMKKTILFMLASLLIVTLCNCSSSNNDSDSVPPTPTVTKGVSVKIDGVQKIFSQVEITQQPWEDNGVPKVDLHVKAINPDDDTEIIYFGIGKGDIGEDQLWAFVYEKGGTQYSVGEDEGDPKLFNATTINIEKRIAGTFSGAVMANEVNHVLSDGIFDITYD